MAALDPSNEATTADTGVEIDFTAQSKVPDEASSAVAHSEPSGENRDN